MSTQHRHGPACRAVDKVQHSTHRSVLAAGIAMLLSAQAGAQQAAAGSQSSVTDLDAVQVTGTRASIRKSQAIKQDAVGTVDAVSAEDVGKFPDQNVADALQRVPGVSVDRSSGESRFITVRGFGPQFNTVLLNGRTMATENAGREFSFDILPSELISTAEVHKTSSAEVSEGGIGATVNIRTQRPLDHPGLHLAGTLAGVEDSTTDATRPKLSGLISNTNADGTFGGLLSVVRYQRNHSVRMADTSGWLTGDKGRDGIAVPRTVSYSASDEKRTRSGVNAAFDWRPSDRLKLGFDAMYARYKIDKVSYNLGLWTDPADIEQISADANGTATAFVRSATGNLATDYSLDGDPRDSSNQQFGLNLAWQLDDQTTLDFDGAYSKAEDDTAGKHYFVTIGRRNIGVHPTYHLDPGGFPTYGNLLPLTNTAHLAAHNSYKEGDTVSDELGEFKAGLTRIFSEGTLSRLQFGVSGSRRTKDSYSIHTPPEISCAYCGYAVGIPADLVKTFDSGGMVGGGPTQWLTFDPAAYFAYLESPAAYDQAAPGGPYYNPDDPERAQRIADQLARYGGITPFKHPLDGWKVRENNYAAYAQTTFEGDWAQRPWLLAVGVRYVRTDTTSHALSAQVASITGNPGDPTNARVNFTDPVPLSKSSSYHDWLPSFNFRMNLRENLILRASASQTLTRPTLTDLRANESIGVRPPGPGTYDTGNIDLKPYTAKNADLGIEWYLDDTSYLALAGFYKNVRNFITRITVPTTILGYPFLKTAPVNADAAIIKGAELSFQYTFDQLPAPLDGLGIQLNYTCVHSQQAFDRAIASGQFAVEGLSDSGNLVLFYENSRFGFRAAYNWRDQYLSAVRGAEGEPTTVEPYGQLDLSTSFKLGDHVSLFAEATNVTHQTESAWSRYKSRPQWIADNGRTLTFGIRGAW